MLLLEIENNRIDIPSAVISIVDNYKEIPILVEGGMIKHVFSIDFIDLYEPLEGYKTFTLEEGIKIADFVYKIKDTVNQLIVHCEAGVSRSSAVAAAIAHHFFEEGDNYFNNSLYLPNKLVYKLTLKACRKYKYIT
jgi:predicted protein tyrosine phosphatase